MRLWIGSGFPGNAMGGGDCLTGRTQLEPGERVIDLEKFYDEFNLPQGRVCVAEGTVKAMAKLLKYDIDKLVKAGERAERAEFERDEALAELEALRDKHHALCNALAPVVEDLATLTKA